MSKFWSHIFLVCGALCYAQHTDKKPNIIWITCEDISPYISVYGDKVIKTPNIDQLAKDGIKFNSTYTVEGVCSPSRSGIITGMYPTSIGTQHMRTEAVDPKFMPKGVPPYSAVLPEYVKAFPEYLRKEGYYTSNNQKEDYQFRTPATVWDESSPAADFKNRKKDQPFFSVYNLFITHESQVMKFADTITVDASKVQIPSFYDDTPTTRKDLANLFTRIETMDEQVGLIIQRLKNEGLYDNSYIFFFSDHGGNLPWMKREILERGTHIPFVVKLPDGNQSGTENNDLISSIDFAPTVLSIAGIKAPKYYQGQAFLGEYSENSKRKYVFAARDRMDEKYDRVRAVRDGQFRYIYNYMPDQPKYQDIAYRKGIPLMKEILEKRNAGKITNSYLADWFKPAKPVEELYDVTNDPDEVHNLASNPKYAKKLKELRKAFKKWTKKVGDMSSVSEREMVVTNWWNGKETQPVTAKPEILVKDGKITLSSSTKGASIGYKILKNGESGKEKRTVKSYDLGVVFGSVKNGKEIEVDPSYSVYQGEEITLNKGEILKVNAMRIGYKPSEATYENQ